MYDSVIPQGAVARANDLALTPIIDPKKFSFVVNKMRTFFFCKKVSLRCTPKTV